MQNQFDFEQLVKERTQSELLDLHSEFSAYDNYSERIDFWDRHYLGLQLWYKIGIGEFLSILPVNESDIELFTEWALTFRMELRNYIEEYPSYKRPTLRVSNGCLFGDSFKVKEREFWQQFSSSPDRDSLLERTFYDLSNPKGSTLSLYGTFMTGDNNGEFYQSAERDLLKGESVKEILLYHFKSIPRAQWERYWNVWEVIDKVLDIESNLHFNGFLRDLKSSYNKGVQIGIPSEYRVVETHQISVSVYAFCAYCLARNEWSDEYTEFENSRKKGKWFEEKAAFFGLGSHNTFEQHFNAFDKKEKPKLKQSQIKQAVEILGDKGKFPNAQSEAKTHLDPFKES
ncbi:hypothetical protein GVN20_28255 [Runella sp. CRIBMP]|uniref:hypothetical protein n=1 Tax=Runella sp. CRIBMP TaxID=2683261 RepID=UPI001412F48D|nr:hypothetical protein [Runella sp. CRIBMP]NBB23277.1 hypothetical protein [Runella sp. CRIBMP]